MANKTKALTNSFKAVIEDIMDNYEDYNPSEKEQVKNALEKLKNLNSNLDKYDKGLVNAFQKVQEAWNNFFGN